MVIKITGNKESFQINKKVQFLELELRSETNNQVVISYDGIEIIFADRQQFYLLAEKSKGASKEKLYILLKDINNGLADRILGNGEIEVGLFKSILIIYLWVEIAFANPYSINLYDRIYDDFVIDYTGKPEVQKDIYFIKSKYLEDLYKPLLNRLVELNLLVSASFNSASGNCSTFFIPLIKPGVSRINFNNEVDPSGNGTYNLWKEILKDRDIKMRNWINDRNRF